MGKVRSRNFREKEILTLLMNNGPLSFKGISRLIKPPMPYKKLQVVLSRLQKKNLIKKRIEKMLNNNGVYYQLSSVKKFQKDISDILEVPVKYLDQKPFRYRELIHNELCAFWMNDIKSLLPGTYYFRDFEFEKYPIIERIMSFGGDDTTDLKPDFIYTLGNLTENKFISVAVEIERSRKSYRRISRKLNKYANATFIDGVVYLCDDENVMEGLKAVYKDKILSKSIRIGHYPKNFILYKDSPFNENSSEILLQNFDGKSVPLLTWTHYLKATSFNSRQDQDMAHMGGTLPPYGI